MPVAAATSRLADAAAHRIADAAAAAALFADLRDATLEQARVALIDPEWRLLDVLRFTGGVDGVAVPVRAVILGALRCDAAAMILAHNHPGGDAAPSLADRAYTRALARAAATLDLALVDHLILTRNDTTSFRELGLL